jgi:hypothetical protein
LAPAQPARSVLDCIEHGATLDTKRPLNPLTAGRRSYVNADDVFLHSMPCAEFIDYPAEIFKVAVILASVVFPSVNIQDGKFW